MQRSTLVIALLISVSLAFQLKIEEEAHSIFHSRRHHNHDSSSETITT